MVLILCQLLSSALASDGVEDVSLEDLVRWSDAVAIVKCATPCVTRDPIEVPLATTPPRKMEWTEGVEHLEVVEVVSAGRVTLEGAFAAVGPQAASHFQRSVRYEVEGVSRGLIHRRYEGSLDLSTPLDGRTYVVFLDAPSSATPEEPSLAAWHASFGAHWTVLGRDDISVVKRVRRLLKKD